MEKEGEDPPSEKDFRDLKGALKRERDFSNLIELITCPAKFLCPAFKVNPKDCAAKNGESEGCWFFRDEYVLFMRPSEIICEHAKIGEDSQCHYAGRRDSYCNSPEGPKGYKICGTLFKGHLTGEYSPRI